MAKSGANGTSYRRVSREDRSTLGTAVLIDGKHMCAMARGVRDVSSIMKVNVMHGSFQKDESLRAELFMRLGET